MSASPQGARASTSADYHALLWLTYSYLAAGPAADAKAVLNQIEEAAAESGSVRTRSHLALARAAWLIETQEVDRRQERGGSRGARRLRHRRRPVRDRHGRVQKRQSAGGNDALQRIALLAGDGDRPLRSVTTARPNARRAVPAPSRPASRQFRRRRPAMPTMPGVRRARTAADRHAGAGQQREARGGGDGAAAGGRADLRRGPARGSASCWHARPRPSKTS